MAQAMDLASPRGALVSNVDDNSPAARAGLRQGDVITEYNGKPVSDSNQLRNEVAATTPGSTVSLQVLRNGHTENLKATVAELPSKGGHAETTGERSGEGRFGMSVQPLTPDVAEQVGVPRTTRGVVVADIDPSGIAADSGLQEGDVIEKVDGQAVTSVEALKSVLDRDSGKPALLIVNRKGTDLFLTLRSR
jgi:serine protease Do